MTSAKPPGIAEVNDTSRLPEKIRDSAGLALLAARLAALEHQKSATLHDDDDNEGQRTTLSNNSAEPAPDFEERKADVVARHEAAIELHHAESVDINWSDVASKQLSTSLQKIGDSVKFTVQNVDCRTSSCVANLHWQSLQDARKDYGDLLHADLGDLTCAREILLSDGEPQAPTDVSFLVNNCRRSN